MSAKKASGSDSQQNKTTTKQVRPSLYEEIASVMAEESKKKAIESLSNPTASTAKKPNSPSESSPNRVKTASDLSKEIWHLKHQLSVSRMVYITDPGGLLRHAYGSIEDGAFNPNSPGVLWDVGLEICEADSVEVKELGDIEIRVGGVVFATSSDVALNAVRVGTAPGNKFDGDDMGRSVACLFSSGIRNDTWEPRTNGWPLRCAWLTFHLPDINDVSWNNLRTGAEDDDIDLYKAIVAEILWKRARLTSISFCAESVWGIIDNLKRGPSFEKEKEEQHARMYGLMSEAAYEADGPSSSSESSHQEMSCEEDQSSDDESRDVSEDEEDNSNDESGDASKSSDEDDEEEPNGNPNDKVKEKTALDKDDGARERKQEASSKVDDAKVAINYDNEAAQKRESNGSPNDRVKEKTALDKDDKAREQKKEASSKVEDAKVAVNYDNEAAQKRKEQNPETGATEEPPCKKMKADDDASCASGDSGESGIESPPSKEMTADEQVASALDFLLMKSLCPKRVVTPRRTVKFVGAWFQL